ncbi:MAG: hypothetical protein MJ003_03830 [Paludibacteraceae bacterium]|nr:hypothetical protein [Paludibacteraceae bacterium]
MSEPIRFYKGEETGIVHENYKEKETSLFKDQYNKALNEIGAYLSASSTKDTNENNIFAFMGDRGTGKTSCMESVAQMLCDMNLESESRGFLKKDNTTYQEAIEKNSYLILDTIDPTIFERNINILDVVIGVLFERVQQKIECSDRCFKSVEEYEQAKQYLFDAFQKVKECLKFIKKPELLISDDDDFSQIADMASVSRLKSQMENLTDKFLAFFKSDVLVIAIDDIDLQSKHAYDMLEQLRKYFMFKNVIILMAFKYEQMLKVLAREFTKDYYILIRTNQLSISSIEEMAAKYLTKLVPINHRIILPASNEYLGRELKYFLSRKDETEKNSWATIKNAIVSLIFTKCRFLFYNTKGEISPIVPRNLRELRHLFTMLYEMTDYYPDEEQPSYDFRINNKAQFLGYFYSTWVNNHIKYQDHKIVNIIKNLNDSSVINKTVLKLLNDKYKNTALKGRYAQNLFPEILAEDNLSYNVSIADVFVVVDNIKKFITNIDDKMLIFFIETYYSFKLYEYYDELTDEQSHEESQGKKNERIINNSIRKISVVDNFSNYAILVGGRFINPEYNNLLPVEQETKKARDYRPISFDLLKKYAQEVISAEVMTDDMIQKMRVVEFFALCTSRVLQAGDNTTNAAYRMLNDLSYDFDFDSQNSTVLFDLGAFFFNIADIRSAYNKIDLRLFGIASNRIESLYTLLTEGCKIQRDGYEEEHALLSCVCIRNYEILTDFVYYIQFNRLRRSPSKSNIENLKAFFNKVALYRIFNYDKHNNKKGEKVPNAISFKYAAIISSVLYSLNEDGEKIFESIFNINDADEDTKMRNLAPGRVTLDTFDIEKLMKLLPDRDEFSLHTFRRRVRDCCDPLFRNNRNLAHAWLYADVFKNGITGKKISREDALKVLVEFKNTYELK